MLHPQTRRALAAETGELSVSDPTTDIAAMRSADREAAAAAPREAVARVSDHDADGVRVRLYQPAVEEPLPVIVHLHGGGFVFNDIDVHDAAVRRLANRSGLAVLSVDYRRPPEHRFPAAPDDVDTALVWLQAHGGSLGVDVSRLIAHGDSAGGNLALVAALRHPGLFESLVLIYPFIDASMRHDSYDEAIGLWNREEATWYWTQYASSPTDYTNPDFSPYDATGLADLPRTLVITCEYDPVRDEGEALAARVADAGVECVATRFLGVPHGIWRHPDDFDAAELMMGQVVAFLRSGLH